MPSRILPVCLLACCLMAVPARALDPGKSFHHYVRDSWSLQQGMPQISAVAIAQTPDGYLWIGTQGGLTRFDGIGFTTFTPANEPAIPHPLLSALAVDGDGNLWIGTRSGMSVMREGRFQALEWKGPGGAPYVFGLHVDAEGLVWAATTAGVARVEDDALRPLEGAGHDRVHAVLPGADGSLWAGGLNGVSRWNGEAWSATRWAGEEPPVVYDLLEIDGRPWAATTHGLRVHDGQTWRPAPGLHDGDALPLRFLYRDSSGNLWAGGDLGLLRVRPGGDVERIPGTRGNGLFNLFSALEDSEGNLWLGSLSNGLSRVWNGWTRRYSIEEGLPDATVWALAPGVAGDGIWVGTNHGLARLGRAGRFTAVPAEADARGAVLAIFTEPGRVWYGLRRGLALYEPGSGRPARLQDWARGTIGSVRGIWRDPEGFLWISSDDGLARWNGRRLLRFGPEQGLPGPLTEHRFVSTRDGRRLALSRSGLFEFDGEAFRPAPEGEGLPEGVSFHSLSHLSDGRLLVSSVDAALLVHNEGRWHAVDGRDGLFPGLPFQIVEHDSTLWVSSMHGVYRLRLDDLDGYLEGRLERLAPEMLLNEHSSANGGQQTVCCNGSGQNDGFMAGDTLWLPTRDGVLALDTTTISYNPHAPQVHVGRIQVGDQWRSLDPGAATVLQAGERDLTLAFDVLSFQESRGNGARYRLTGYDQEWKTAPPMVRQVRYTNLPPGDYAFEVLGSNNAGVWSNVPARLQFSITPYFHETAAFRFLLGALLVLLVWSGYRYQRYRYHARQAELETLVGERTAALAESNRQLEQASVTDPLTGLRNRRYVAQQLPGDLDYYDRQLASARAGSEAVVFAMLDLDHFKQVNDRHGHAAGDHVLREVARRLQDLVRSGDYVIRWGGEEFLLVFRPMPAGQVPQLGARLQAAISARPFDLGEGRSASLTVSVGLAEYSAFRRDRPLGWEALVELADQALYHVKRSGRDGWAMFRPTASTRMETLLADLQRDPDALLRSGGLELVTSRDPAPPAAG